MVVITGRLRNINGSTYLIVRKDVREELNIDLDNLPVVQAEIKVIKRVKEVDTPQVIDEITEEEIRGGQSE